MLMLSKELDHFYNFQNYYDICQDIKTMDEKVGTKLNSISIYLKKR